MLLLLLVISLVGLFCSKSGEGAVPSPWDLYADTPADSVEAALVIIENDPAAFAAAFDSLLAAGGARPADTASLTRASLGYLEATGDSLLLADLAFVQSATPADRAAWYRAVGDDLNALRLRNARDLPAAIAAYTRAAEAYARVGHLRREAVAWGSLGVAHWFAGDFSSVKAAYAKALDARVRLGDALLIGRTLNGLGSVHLQTGEYEAALGFYQRARAVREKLDRPVDLGQTLTYIGNVHYRMGKLEQAYAGYTQALEILGEDAPARRIYEARLGLANVYTSLGEHRRALDAYRALLRDAAEDDLGTRAQLRYNASGPLFAMGDYAAALAELLAAWTIQEGAGWTFDLAFTLNRAGQAYRQLGDYPRALEVLREAERAAVESENALEEANAVSNLGVTYMEMGLHERALESLNQAKAIFEELGDPLGERSVLNSTANAHYKNGDFEQSLETNRSALDIDHELGREDFIAEDQGNIGSAYTAMGRLEEGMAALRKAVTAAAASGHTEALWGAYLGIADNFEQQARLDSARVYNGRAIDEIESLRGAALSAETKAAFLGGKAFVYEAQVHVLAKLAQSTGNPAYAAEALSVAERGKARALLDLLQQGQVDVDAGLSPKEVAERETLLRALNAVRYRVRLATEGGAPRDEVRGLQRELREAEANYTQLLDRLRLENAKFAATDAGKGWTADELQNHLVGDGKTVLLEYALGDSASYLWVVTKKNVRMVPLPPRATLESRVKRLRGALTTLDPAGYAPLLTEAVALHQELLAPAEKELAKAKSVLVVPDGVLGFLPFDVLLAKAPPLPEGADASVGDSYFRKLAYTLDGKRVVYGPSATSLAVLGARRQDDRQHPVRDLLAVGDPDFGAAADSTGERSGGGLPPLPFTRDEVVAIHALFKPDRATMLLGAEARESAFAAARPQDFRLLHFATHGLVDERRPERSSIALSSPQNADEDGFLQASEIYRLNLNADLVVLSACETGLGRMIRGEGVLGLPRAFLHAGASSVVVSLWSVSDQSTSDLMVRFYKELIKKKRTPAEALSRAKQGLRKESGFAHPFYWAPFVVLGTSSER